MQPTAGRMASAGPAVARRRYAAARGLASRGATSRVLANSARASSIWAFSSSSRRINSSWRASSRWTSSRGLGGGEDIGLWAARQGAALGGPRQERGDGWYIGSRSGRSAGAWPRRARVDCPARQAVPCGPNVRVPSASGAGKVGAGRRATLRIAKSSDVVRVLPIFAGCGGRNPEVVTTMMDSHGRGGGPDCGVGRLVAGGLETRQHFNDRRERGQTDVA
jgi:hypothetical protein